MMNNVKKAIWRLAGVGSATKGAELAKPMDGEILPCPKSQKKPGDDSGGRNPAANDAAIEKAELETKIASRRCDLHPLYLLQNTAIEILLPDSSILTRVKASSCTKHYCNRHFVQELGYFPYTAGEQPHFHPIDSTPKCVKHESFYMAVAKVSGDFTWACLELGCAHSAP